MMAGRLMPLFMHVQIGSSMSSRRFVFLSWMTLTLVCATGLAHADQDLYKCVDAHGNVTYANTGRTKGCTRIGDDPVVIPKLATPQKSQASPSTFPKVDSTTQKARDSDRRRILDDELRDKEAKLADLKREDNNGEPERQGDERNYQRYLDRAERLKDDIARAGSDIGSIESEIDKVQERPPQDKTQPTDGATDRRPERT